MCGQKKIDISLRQTPSRNPDRPEMRPEGKRRQMRDDRMTADVI